MRLDREKIKARIERSVEKAFSERRTINAMLAVGLNEMVDAIIDELEQKPTKKVA